MVPKVGDLVILNPALSEHPILQSRIVAFGPNPRPVVYLFRDEDGGNVTVDFGWGLEFIVHSDGSYFREIAGSPSLFLLASSDRTSLPEPRNNDGRRECFWCHISTAKRGGGMYDVCPKCGR